MFVEPSGEVISDTLCESEGLLYQDIDIAECVEQKQFHDVVGYYHRFDVLDLKVTRKRLSPIQFLMRMRLWLIICPATRLFDADSREHPSPVAGLSARSRNA
jgi:hypothetical protein